MHSSINSKIEFLSQLLQANKQFSKVFKFQFSSFASKFYVIVDVNFCKDIVHKLVFLPLSNAVIRKSQLGNFVIQ
jgi:hypothetical protein